MSGKRGKRAKERILKNGQGIAWLNKFIADKQGEEGQTDKKNIYTNIQML